ncbi:MAG: hypothetical protein DRP60_12915 [Spirochaetes bacterium]|nr:MAG: hypothetical protein DRP60_12915 [Spirochaetota bacterium]
MKKIYSILLFFLVLLASCRPDERGFSPPSDLSDLDVILLKASTGSLSDIEKLAREGGRGAWFALAAAAGEAGYHNLAHSLQVISAQKDEAPFGLISLGSVLIDNPEALENPLRALKKAEKVYGPDERLRQARIVVFAAQGNDKDLVKEMDNYRGKSWEAPALAAVLRRGEMDAEQKAITERYILHVSDPEFLLLLPEDSIDELSPAYKSLFAGRTTGSLEGYRAWLSAASVAEEVCSLESSPPVFAEMFEAAREVGLEGEWAGILGEAASKLCGSKRFGASFQAGRLYREIGKYREASSAFLSASVAVPRGLPRDRAMWYHLKTMFEDNSVSLSEELEAFSRTAGYWDDSERFDDVLEEFLHRRVRRGEWAALEAFYRDWGSSWPPGGKSLAAWLLAFARWEGRLPGDESSAESIKEYLETAFEAAPWSWAGLRAAGILEKDLSLVFQPDSGTIAPGEPGEDDLVIRLYLDWGLNHLAGDTVMKNPELYSEKTVRLTAHAMEDENPRLSIRIAGQLWGREGFIPVREDLILRYPLPYGSLAGDIAVEQGLSPEILNGLVRTESAWDYQAVSRSGAEGLAQFMPSTWNEWTRRLRLPEDADPMDPQTNLTLAAAYLEWLYLRDWTFGWPDVLVSYNAGGGRLRGWRRELPGLGEDLFGMSLPVEEPRSYIRKVLSAATIYGYLYAGKTPRSLHEEWDLEIISVNLH